MRIKDLHIISNYLYLRMTKDLSTTRQIVPGDVQNVHRLLDQALD